MWRSVHAWLLWVSEPGVSEPVCDTWPWKAKSALVRNLGTWSLWAYNVFLISRQHSETAPFCTKYLSDSGFLEHGTMNQSLCLVFFFFPVLSFLLPIHLLIWNDRAGKMSMFGTAVMIGAASTEISCISVQDALNLNAQANRSF